MFETIIANYIGVDTPSVRRILSLTPEQIYADPVYNSWIESLDMHALYDTLIDARTVYERFMPGFAQSLTKNYGVKHNAMSAYTLGNWLVGFLQFPGHTVEMPQIHRRVPREAVLELLPGMLAALGEMPDGGGKWQQALAVLSLPLASANR